MPFFPPYLVATGMNYQHFPRTSRPARPSLMPKAGILGLNWGGKHGCMVWMERLGPTGRLVGQVGWLVGWNSIQTDRQTEDCLFSVCLFVCLCFVDLPSPSKCPPGACPPGACPISPVRLPRHWHACTHMLAVLARPCFSVFLRFCPPHFVQPKLYTRFMR